ncbi:flagellar biosynthesis protein FlaG [Sporolactobacillus shoreae]|uniref:Flagellar biosynthesis protein FlaG n=1 Tax=Sporolactobacillus shoreae TaxID=1465501 RepID=A0A4Z0GKG7_9BACL|nr:flagellar protein FlaG [Sporolactobacillus shoreae]TGA97402.1 flagellar biosynthesis protein FlaG [Sporolactobacillus shoreae]
MNVSVIRPENTVQVPETYSFQNKDDSPKSVADGETQQENEKTRGRMKQMAEEANKVLQPVQTELHYVFYDKLDRYYVQVVNTRTREVVREIPPKKELDFYAAIAQQMGLITNHKI